MQFFNRTTPEQVIVSRRAHGAIVAETLEHHPNETGGILLGHRLGPRWHVIEAIDPGPASRFSPVSFEYDTDYVNHLARKVARLYHQPLHLIGLWHRHPGSFDQFSGTDDITNRRYAEQSADGALSCLVNLDPHFRLTAYHVPADLAYRRLTCSCNDHAIPEHLQRLRDASSLQVEVLAERAQQHELQQVFAQHPLPAAPLLPPVAAHLNAVMELLDGQQRYGYGLRSCGDQLQLALVEHNGRGRHLLQLWADPTGSLAVQLHSEPQLQGLTWLQQLLQGVGHGC
jgi:proteasome lid subunit RPN8/RPN11